MGKTYELYVENLESEQLLSRIKKQVDYFNRNKKNLEQLTCWTGWNNFCIEYAGDVTMRLQDMFLPIVYPTQLIGCIKEKNKGILVEYQFQKTKKTYEKFKKIFLIFLMILGFFWLICIGDTLAGKIVIKNIVVASLLTLASLITYLRGKSIPAVHKKRLQTILICAIQGEKCK